MALPFLEALLYAVSCERKLPSLVWEIVPAALKKLEENGRSWNVEHSRGFLLRLLRSPLHAENIFEIMLTLKDVPFLSLAEPIFFHSLKLMERIPTKIIPSAIYQTLQWCRNSPKLHKNCFDTIFAIMEAKSTSDLDISECISCINLALRHESGLLESFLRESRSLIKNGLLMSPFMMIILLSFQETKDGNDSMISRYFLQMIELQDQIEKMQLEINWAQWPDFRKIFRHILVSIPANEEGTLRALIDLSLQLAKAENPTVSMIGLEFVNDVFRSFPCCHQELLDNIILLLWNSLLAKDFKEHLFSWFDSFIASHLSLLSLIIKDEQVISLLDIMSKLDLLLLNVDKFLAQPRLMNVVYDAINDDNSFGFFHCCVGFLSQGSEWGLAAWRLFDNLVHDRRNGSRILEFLITYGSQFPAFSNILLSILDDHCASTDPLKWPAIIGNCLNLQSNHVTCFLPLLLKAILVNPQRTQEYLVFQDEMNELVRLLFQSVDWFPPEMTEATKLALMPLIVGLFDVALEVSLNTEESTMDWQRQAISNILEQRKTLIGSIETLIPPKYYHCMSLESFSVLITVIKRDIVAGKSITVAELLDIYNLPIRPGRQNNLPLAPFLDLLGLLDLTATGIDVEAAQKKAILSSTGSFLNHHKQFFAFTSDDCNRLCRILLASIGADLPSREIVPLVTLLKVAVLKLPNPSYHSILRVATEACEKFQAISESDSLLSKALLSMALFCASRYEAEDSIYRQVTRDLSCILKSIREPEGEKAEEGRRNKSIKLKVIAPRTKESILALFLSQLDDDLSYVDQVFKRALKITWNIYDAFRVIEKIFPSLKRIVTSCTTLCQLEVTGANHINLMQILVRLFKLVALLCKQFHHRHEIPLELSIILNLMADQLTANIYEMVPVVQQTEIEEIAEVAAQKKKKAKVLSTINNRLNRESRLIPDLIFNIEFFERSVIMLAKAHNVTIVRTFHRSTARDFRIQVEELDQLLRDGSSKSSEEENPNETNLNTVTSLQISTHHPDSSHQ